MPKIKKIKRDQLSELGEGFDVLSDDEVQDSGIQLGDDEVLIIATPAPVQPTSGQSGGSDEVATLKARLHTVNQESASRRIELKNLQTQLNDLQAMNQTLTKAKTDFELAETKRQAKELFSGYVSGKKLEFASAEAGSDVQDIVFGQIDWTKPVTPEVIGPIVDSVLEKKTYYLKTVDLGRTDGGKQSAGAEGVVDVDLDSIAAQFGIPYKREGAKE